MRLLQRRRPLLRAPTRGRPILLRAASLCALAALVAGCSAISNTITDYWGGKDNSEPPAPLVEFKPSLQVTEVWNRSIGSGVEKYYLKLRPLVEGGRVIAAARDGRVAAYAAATGEPIWRTDLEHAPISGGPGGGENMALVGTSDGEVIALAADTGKLLWRVRVSSSVLAPPVAAHGIVVARTIDGKVFGLSAKDGKRVWVYDRTVPVLTLRGASTPAIASGTVVVGFASGRLVALGLQRGELYWETAVAEPRGRSELDRMVDIDGDPVIADGVVYVVTYHGRVSAVDLHSGNVIWRRDMSSTAGVGIDARNLYVTDESSQVWALDRGNSASVWRQDKLRARAVTAPLAFHGYVVVGDYQGYVHWLSSDDGHFVARVQVDSSGILSAPVTDGKRVYVYGRSGTVAALETH